MAQLKPLNKLQLAIQYAGGGLMILALIAGILCPLSGITPLAVPQVYSCGTLMFACMQMLQRYEGKNPVIRRLRRMQILGDVFLILSGFAMLLPTFTPWYGHRNEWVVLLAVGTVLLLWTVFRLPTELEKEP